MILVRLKCNFQKNLRRNIIPLLDSNRICFTTNDKEPTREPFSKFNISNVINEYTRVDKQFSKENEKVKLPMDALWKGQTQKALDNFPISGYKMPTTFLKSLGLIKYCAARTNEKLGLIEESKANAIAEVALSIYKGDNIQDAFPVDVFQTGSGTSTNMNMNEVISQLVHITYGLQVHPNDDVNRGQSSNDTIPTAIATAAVIDFYYNLLPTLESLIDAINLRATEYEDTPKLSRTHLMDAVPITVAQELRAWSSSLEVNKKYLTENIIQCQRIPIGGTAVGTGLNTHKDFAFHVINELNAMTGIKFLEAPNKFEMLSNPVRLTSLASALKLLAVSLSKINNDIRWMNSGPLGGLGELQLPEMQAGSSIMPGKVNPVISESVCMVAAHVMGSEQTISLACMSGSNFQLNTMFPLIAYHLLENMRLLTNSMKNMQSHLIEKMVYRKEHLQNLVEKSPMMITALNNIIGYEEGKRIIQRYYEETAKIKDIKKLADQYEDGIEQPKTLLQICEEELKHIEKEKLREILDPLKLAKPHQELQENTTKYAKHESENGSSIKPTKSDNNQPPQPDAQPLTVPWLGPYDSCQKPKP